MPSFEMHKMVSGMNKKKNPVMLRTNYSIWNSTLGTASVLSVSLHVGSWNNPIEENNAWGRVTDFCAVVQIPLKIAHIYLWSASLRQYKGEPFLLGLCYGPDEIVPQILDTSNLNITKDIVM